MLGSFHTIIDDFLNHVFHAIWFYLLTYEPKHSKRTTMMLTIVSATLAEAISLFSFMYFENKQTALTFTFYVASVTYAFFYIFLMQGAKKIKSLFIYFTYIGIWSAVYIVVMILTRNVLGGWPPAMWILRSLFNIILLIAYKRYFKELIIQLLPVVEKTLGLLIVVSGMTYLLLPTLMIYYAYGTQTTLSLVAIIFLLMFSIMVYCFMFRFIWQIRKENEFQAIEAQNKFLLEAKQNAEEQGKIASKVKHDEKHKNSILLGYAKAGDVDAIIRYLAKAENDEDELEEQKYCSNETVDIILQSYIRKAEKNNIIVKTDIRMDEDTTVSEVDLVAILGNMLENAINGCAKVNGERSMEISIYHRAIKLIMICKNTCALDIRFENGLPRRGHGEGNGVGVSSIMMSAERYEGEVAFSEEKGIFTCAVMLNDIKN